MGSILAVIYTLTTVRVILMSTHTHRFSPTKLLSLLLELSITKGNLLSSPKAVL